MPTDNRVKTSSSYQASKDDIVVHAEFSAPPSADYVNVSRWYNHIEALLRMSGVSGEGQGVNVEGSTTIFEEAPASPTIADTKGFLLGSRLAQRFILGRVFSSSRIEETSRVDEDDDDNVDLFSEETEEEKKVTKDCAATVKASRKKKESGKSSVLLDIKPWDDETDMQKLEVAVRSAKMEGLQWGACM
ncbi:hypothetical protein KFK09_003383 [Dendrobium nobile]|uniref:Translation elongation factor EF1B beta/delta subunit guanine nucleotide exchange domain-containing protein n=1 Tax=Dendrobium nobile TaxID=94219 RepID=A0A8T3BXM8_DENNO|nr:hypothetical protein KFK09_003383 [Dendrobium nobile]